MGLNAASGTMAELRVVGAVSLLALCLDIDVVVSVFGDANAPGGTGMLLVALAIASGTMASMGNRDDAFKLSNTFVLRMENVSQFNRDPGHLQWVPQSSCPRSCRRVFQMRWHRYIIDMGHHYITLHFRGGLDLELLASSIVVLHFFATGSSQPSLLSLSPTSLLM